MAIYHQSVKVIGRNRGQSAIAAAAYRSGEKLTDEATGQVKHYPARGERIRFTGIFAPAGAPSWVYDRNRLWNAAEQAEKRKDATLAREIVLALPHELTDQQRQWLVSDFVREAFVRRGLVADVAIHAPDRNSDPRNFHAHILITERTIRGVGKPAEKIRAPELAGEFPPDRQGDDVPVDPGFAPKKDRSLYGKETLYGWREQWSNLCNRHLARHNHAARIDHRTLAEQRIDREPTRHLGLVDAQRMRRGVSTVRGDGLRAIRLRNALRAVRVAAREIASLPETGAGRVGARTGIRVAATVAASSMFKPQAKESHDYSTGASVGHDELRQIRAAEAAPQLIDAATFDRAGGEIATHCRARSPPERHAADTGGESPSEPCSLDAEVMTIAARYASAIEAARKSGRSRFEIEATIRALREQQRAEIHGVRERRRVLHRVKVFSG